jgi:hypothetical protein
MRNNSFIKYWADDLCDMCDDLSLLKQPTDTEKAIKLLNKLITQAEIMRNELMSSYEGD